MPPAFATPQLSRRRHFATDISTPFSFSSFSPALMLFGFSFAGWPRQYAVHAVDIDTPFQICHYAFISLPPLSIFRYFIIIIIFFRRFIATAMTPRFHRRRAIISIFSSSPFSLRFIYHFHISFISTFSPPAFARLLSFDFFHYCSFIHIAIAISHSFRHLRH
jgi:hypothetical protein